MHHYTSLIRFKESAQKNYKTNIFFLNRLMIHLFENKNASKFLLHQVEFLNTAQ